MGTFLLERIAWVTVESKVSATRTSLMIGGMKKVLDSWLVNFALLY